MHEMIHARIDALQDIYKEIITVCLYEKLKKDIRKNYGVPFNLSALCRFFDQCIHDNFEFPEFLWHGPLFFMKSLDLDLRLGFPLFTVYGYRYKTIPMIEGSPLEAPA